VRAVPNLKVSHAMLQALRAWLEIDLELAELRMASRQLERRVDAAIDENPELRDYVQQLGVSLDESAAAVADDTVDLEISRPDPAEVLRELEELLRGRRDEPDQ
jgi:hypothetical protein